MYLHGFLFEDKVADTINVQLMWLEGEEYACLLLLAMCSVTVLSSAFGGSVCVLSCKVNSTVYLDFGGDSVLKTVLPSGYRQLLNALLRIQA